MKSHDRNKTNAMKSHPHKIDETNPDIFLNADLVKKPEAKDNKSQKACKNCCDQCRAKKEKENPEHTPPL